LGFGLGNKRIGKFRKSARVGSGLPDFLPIKPAERVGIRQGAAEVSHAIEAVDRVGKGRGGEAMRTIC
jgi:hypothetical protein